MDWKEVVKPTLLKVIIAVVLFVAIYNGMLIFTGGCCEQPTYVGLPIPFYYHQASLMNVSEYFSYPLLALDFIITYLVVACIVTAYKK